VAEPSDVAEELVDAAIGEWMHEQCAAQFLRDGDGVRAGDGTGPELRG
jgi:hypothetical protein